MRPTTSLRRNLEGTDEGRVRVLNVLFPKSSLSKGDILGKFPIADAQISKIVICRKCKSRNKLGVERCRKCGYSYLRPKRKDIRVKK
jgi:ubiquitin-large subunit ribosomal protein L40e